MRALLHLNKVRFVGGLVFISLTQGKETVISRKDWPRVREHRWYAVRSVDRERRRQMWDAASHKHGEPVLYLHRFLFDNPPFQIDHKDCDGLNNRRSNLRPASGSQNCGNTRKHIDAKTSRFKGVYLDKSRGRYMARLGLKNLGRFATEQEAAVVYQKAALRKYKDFARV